MLAGVEALERKEYSAALRSFLDASKAQPNSPEIWSNIGVAYVGKDEPMLAEDSFKKALEVDKDYNDARLNLGVLLSRQKRYPEAERYLREASKYLAYDKLDQVAYFLAVIYQDLNRPLLAEQQLKIALRENSGYCAAWHRLGMIQKERGDYADAARSLAGSVRGICYKNPQAHYEIAALYLKAKDTDLAKKKLLEVIQLFPSSEWAKKSEATLNMIR